MEIQYRDEISQLIDDLNLDIALLKCDELFLEDKKRKVKDIELIYYKMLILYLKENFSLIISMYEKMELHFTIINEYNRKINIETMILVGISYFQVKKYNSAITVFKYILDNSMNTDKYDIGIIFYYLGISYYFCNNLKDAIEKLEEIKNKIKIKELEQENYDKKYFYIKDKFLLLYYFLGMSYFNLEQYDEAYQHIDKSFAISRYEKDMLLNAYLTVILSALYIKKFEAALSYIKIAKKNYKDNINLLIYNFIALINVKEYNNFNSLIDDLFINQDYNKDKVIILEKIIKLLFCIDNSIQNDLNNLIDKKNKIDEIYINIENIYNNISSKNINYENIVLATFFDDEVERLKIDLNGNLNTINNSNATSNKSKSFIKNIFNIKLGYTKKFGFMIFIDIVFIVLLLGLNLFHPNFVDLKIIQNIKIGLSSLFISGILFWVTKYYNRRIHETVQLIEDYQHKSLVLKSFNSYSKEIERLSKDNPEFLLDYLRKVSSTINRSPALDLNKRKADNSPVEDMKDILLQLGSLSNLKK